MNPIRRLIVLVVTLGVVGSVGCGDIVVDPGPGGQDAAPPPADTTGGTDVDRPDTVGGSDVAPDPDTTPRPDVVLPECRLNSDCEGPLEPCQMWRCVEGRCVASPLTGDGCDPGDPCVLEARCEDGQCIAVARVSCEPRACNGTGVCEGGACVYTPVPDGLPCDDQNPCTRDDACAAGACGGTPVLCAPPAPCLEAGTCRPESGRCEYAPTPDGSSCDDGLVCTTGDTCLAGACVATGALLCDDGRDCTLDSCDERLGGCVHDASTCTCTSDDDCTSTNLCLVGAYCDVNTGRCTANVPVDCGDFDSSCARGVCVPATGACEARPVASGAACDDENPCTVTDRCDGLGACAGVPRACDDGIACTIDTCEPATGDCRHDARNCGCLTDADCASADLCAGAGRCDPVTFTCQPGTPVSCAHLDEPCKRGVCDPTTGGCRSEPRPSGTTCDDGDPCTVEDKCASGGQCSGRPKVCDDGLDCTVDTCDPATGGCLHDPSACGCVRDADCDDGNPCNGRETCEVTALRCLPGVAVDCSSLTDTCRVGVCNPADGTCVTETTPGAACDDGNACTTGDQCRSDGVCAGALIRCDDGNPCTTDTCRNGACVSDPASGSSCTSALPCGTLGGVCDAGRCVCACRDGLQLRWNQGRTGGDARGVFTFTSRLYGSTGALVCPSDWLDGGVVRREISDGPVDIQWQRLCAPNAYLWDWRTEYAGATSVWDARARGLLRDAVFIIADSGGTEVARFTANQVQFKDYTPAHAECTAQTTLKWTVNDYGLRGVFADFQGIGSARFGRFRLLLEGSTRWTAWVSGPEDWPDPTLRRAGSMEIENPCGDAATRAEYGDRGLYSAFAAGASSSASIVLRDDWGNEVRRINVFDATIRTYTPSYEGCRTQETLTVTFAMAENG